MTKRPVPSPRGLFRAAAALLLLLAPLPQAQAQYIPYFGKNKISYDTFNWRVYRSPHFEVYYYPEFEQHLARLVSYAESAYQKVSGDLKHEIDKPIPLILYKTHSEFEQTNLFPDFLPEGVLAFAEPTRERMVLPIDEPPDRLQGLITHELTHIFEFEIVPRNLLRRSVPIWVDEGLADYERGIWDSLDLMTIRDAAVTEQVPKITKLNEQSGFQNPRVVYNMGHAAFEFIEARYGKEGIRQFLYTLRKSIVGGGADDLYTQAFRVKPEEFDQAFDKWLKERFKPFRDKQRPSDYGKDLAPDEDKTSFTQVFAFSASPSGELIAALSGNRGEGEADLVLISARDGQVVKNLTDGFTNEFEDIAIADSFVAGHSISFDPRGDTVAFFARRGKRRSLFLVSALKGHIKRRIPVDLDQASGPCLMPDGRHMLFTAIQEGVSDVWMMDLETGKPENLTKDAFYDADPQISPDGKLVVYTRRISGHDKLHAFPLADPQKKTQLTFGTYDDDAPSFSPDGNRVYYSSTEDDDIYNLRSLDLKTGVVRQYTDVLGGNMAPVVLSGKGPERVGFISYFKGEYHLNTIEIGDPIREVDQEIDASPAEIVDFQPDVQHQVIAQNKRRKKLFEGLYLEGRPPLNVGVTSGGDFYGGSQIALSDVLGDKNFTFTAASLREFRSYNGTYFNLSRRLHWGASLFDETAFFFPTTFIPQRGFSREGAFASQRLTGGSLLAQYPLDKFRRVELSAGVVRIQERYDDPAVEQQIRDQAALTGQPFFLRNGTEAPFAVAFVQETTRFREWGPLSGSALAASVTVAPSFGGSLAGSLTSYTTELDARKYVNFGTSVVLAGRFKGFRSTGAAPRSFFFGGNMEMRGFNYLSFAGNTGFFANVELRLPLIDLMATPIGVLGPVRGTLFGNIGGAHYRGESFQFATKDPGISFVKDPVFGTPVSGYHLVDGRASVGAGLQFFFLGYPMHFDFSRLTDLKVRSGKTRFDFWIGYDF
jgi:hypothetical protein